MVVSPYKIMGDINSNRVFKKGENIKKVKLVLARVLKGRFNTSTLAGIA